MALVVLTSNTYYVQCCYGPISAGERLSLGAATFDVAKALRVESNYDRDFFRNKYPSVQNVLENILVLVYTGHVQQEYICIIFVHSCMYMLCRKDIRRGGDQRVVFS